MRHEIDKKNTIRIFNDGEDVPFALQPSWPDNTPWTDKAEAQAWAELLIQSLENPESEFIVGTSPENHPRKRPQYDPETGEVVVSSDSGE